VIREFTAMTRANPVGEPPDAPPTEPPTASMPLLRGPFLQRGGCCSGSGEGVGLVVGEPVPEVGVFSCFGAEVGVGVGVGSGVTVASGSISWF
jgi:hypothetical protein